MHSVLASLTLENFSPAWLWGLIALIALVTPVLTYRLLWGWQSPTLTRWLTLLRVLAVAALLIALVKPAWLTTQHRELRPVVAVVLDTSQSMSLPHAGPDGDFRRSRYQSALAWLDDSPDGRRLREQFDVVRFDIESRRLDGATPSEPQAEQTDLMRALQGVASRMRGRSVAAVVLISDGRDTTGRPSLLALREFPLDVHGISFTAPPPTADDPIDLAVRSVEAPQRVLVHNAAPIRVQVSKDGGPAMSPTVAIERAGQTLLQQRVDMPEGRGEQSVTLDFVPDEPGDFVLAVRVIADVPERTLRNNVRLRRLRVDAEPIRVMYIEGTLRSEYTFLRERLGQDPDVDLITFVRTANPDQPGAPGVLLGGELITPERLEQIDVVLLGDFEALMLGDAAYLALRDWVEAGGGLMVLGGYRNLGADGLGMTPLAPLLPTEPLPAIARELEQVEQPFSFMLTDEGRRHPALGFSGEPEQDAIRWADLPALRGVAATGAARPGASVLARHPATNPHDPQSHGFIVLATQPYGRGEVALLTADTTWRWSRLARLTGRPDTMYVRFWSQMIRHLAGRELDQPVTVLTLATDAASYRRAEPVRITARRNPAAVFPGLDEDRDVSLQLAIRGPDGGTTPLVPQPSTAESGVWEAIYHPDRGGRFEVSAALHAVGAADHDTAFASQSTEFLVEGSDLELDDPTPDPATVRQIAALAGGLYADIDDAESLRRLVEAIPADRRVSVEARSIPMWNSPLLFLVFVGLVAVEWVLRRRHQMA